MITPEKRDELLKSIVEGARRNLEQYGQLVPAFFLIQDSGKSDIVAAAFRNEREKDLTVAEIHRRIAAEPLISMVIFACESWVLKLPEELCRTPEQAEREARRYGSISNHPNRVEIVMFSVESRSGQVMLASSEIDRSSGVPTFKDPDFKNAQTEATGRFTGFFPRVH